MAITIDAIDTTSNSSTNSILGTHINNGNYLVIGFTSGQITGTPGTVTYNGQSLTRLCGTVNSSNANTSLWGLANPPIGTFTYTLSLSTSLSANANGLSFNNVNPGGPTTSGAGTVVAGTSCASTLTTTIGSSVMIVQYATDTTGISSITNGSVLQSGLNELGVSNPLVINATGPYSMTAISVGTYHNNWSYSAIVLSPAVPSAYSTFKSLTGVGQI